MKALRGRAEQVSWKPALAANNWYRTIHLISLHGGTAQHDLCADKPRNSRDAKPPFRAQPQTYL